MLQQAFVMSRWWCRVEDSTDLVDKKTLEEVTCPCLCIVGGNDKKLIEINKKTLDQLTNVKDKKLEIVKGASHLFEEEDKIEEVGNVAAELAKRENDIVYVTKSCNSNHNLLGIFNLPEGLCDSMNVNFELNLTKNINICF